MQLSRRLEALIALVPPGVTAADIGTDHGLVAAELAARGICPHVIATDLRKGPLSAAESLIRTRGLTELVSLRLGDGLSPLKAGEADCLILAGMGGALMQRILSEGALVAKSARTLILAPQSEVPEFRRFLTESGYAVRQEKLVEEEGKFYFILEAGPALSKEEGFCASLGGRPLSDEEYLFGRHLLEEKSPELKRFLEREKEINRKILLNLTGAGEIQQKRSHQVRTYLTQIEGALSRYSHTDTLYGGSGSGAKGETMSSLLGFGLMRLPRLAGGEIDLPQTCEMVDAFLEKGGTYFDTAYVYEGSEEAARKALVERHPRESYTLATKLNARVKPGTAESTKAQFEESLRRTGAGYFDYYLLHNLMSEGKPLYDEFGIWEFVARKKEEGLVKNMGFSFHDKPELLDQLLTEHPEVDFVQLQINYADWENPEVCSRANYEVARKHGKPVVIMEPVKGGTLAALPEEAAAVLRAMDPEASAASWAIRFAASLEGVKAVLSGMSTIGQVRDNTSYMADFRKLSLEERAAISRVQEILMAQRQVPCTACRYCVENCPMSIPIPTVFRVYNGYLRFENAASARRQYAWRIGEKDGKASACVKCGACESACPQHLPIRDLLEEAAAVLE